MTRNSPTGRGSPATMSNASPRRRPNAKSVQYTQARTPARPRSRCPTRPDQLGTRRWPSFRRFLSALRSRCAPALPVVVQVGPVRADVHGYCGRERKNFVIRLSDKLEEEAAVDVLIHEWAHALAWNLEHDRLANKSRISRGRFDAATHGPDWGVAYSRAYLVLTEELASARREHRSARRRRP